MTSSPDPQDLVPWDRSPLGRLVLAVNGSALLVAAVLVVWLVLDADSVPGAVAIAGLVGLAILGLNAVVRLIVMLRNPETFK